MQCAEYRDLVAAHVDERLTEEELSPAVAHVSGCARCASLLRAQRALKQALRAQSFIQPTPDSVRRAIMARIAAEGQMDDAPSSWRAWWSRPVARWALAGALGLLIVAVTVPMLRPRTQAPRPPLFDAIVTDYRAAESDRVTLRKRTDDPMELRVYYHETGAFTFTNTVVDLEPLGLVLVGGTLTELAGKPSTLSVYRGAPGMVVCHRIQADGVELPPGGEIIGGDRFYTVDGITICVHREGDILCFMASTMPRAEFVRRLTGHV